MQDPYRILGIERGTSFEEVRSAYRRACKTRHPDMGGSEAVFVELHTAYEQILNELKHGYHEQRAHKADRSTAEHGREDQQHWEKVYRDIEEELEELRRASEAHEQKIRAMRMRAWEAGERVAWAKLTWRDFAHFIGVILRSGVKGLALLFAAFIGIGSILMDANLVSGLIVLASAIGLFISLALKNDKGGIVSAGLLLFGIMTVWLPPVREALFGDPLATVSVLLCLALIFKFAQQGGTIGLATGGALALYVIGVIVAGVGHRAQSARSPTLIAERHANVIPQAKVPPRARPPIEAKLNSQPNSVKQGTVTSPQKREALLSGKRQPPQPPALPPQPRVLLAAKGSVLKFIGGVPYQLKLRTGFTTRLEASRGMVAFYTEGRRVGECTDRVQLFMQPDHAPYAALDRMIRACGREAIMRVVQVK